MNNILIGFFSHWNGKTLWSSYADISNHDIFINLFQEKDHRNPQSMDGQNFNKVKYFLILQFTADILLQSVLFHHPHHLCRGSLREYHPDFSDLWAFLVANTYVFLHWKLVIPGSLVFCCLYTQNPDDLHLW